MALCLSPGLGGSVMTLRHGDADLLRPTAYGATSPLETACFPLVPYANRIAGGQVRCAGRAATLAPNLAGQPHPLHGDGWLSPWTIERAAPADAVLSHTSAAGEWPWAYLARQSFSLTDEAMTIGLSVTNLDDAEGPFGLGLHPYFSNRRTARMTARLQGAWLAGDDLLPVRHVQGQPFADWGRGARVATRRLIDHCHIGWDRTALIDLGDGAPTLRLIASPELTCLHVYSPPDEDFFCVEPVSHRPDAINAPDLDGMRLLAPGETLEVWMRLRVERPGPVSP